MKQAIVARTDLGMGTGKLAAQVAHASLQAANDAAAQSRRDWEAAGAKKVVLKGESEAHLFELADRAAQAGLPYTIVRDAGHTELAEDTVTALAVGPAPGEHIDKVTGDLTLF